MPIDITTALRDLSEGYVEHCKIKLGSLPTSTELYGIASPCIEFTEGHVVHWSPKVREQDTLNSVEKALDILIRPEIHTFYCQQYAGDIAVRFEELELMLIQVWSEEDFISLQKNLIGHLLMKKQLKHSPTLFIASTHNPEEIISVDNLTGEVVLETLGSNKYRVLAENMKEFIESLTF